MTKDEALEKAIDIAESWIRDQLEGTGMFNDAIKELAPLKEALAQPEQDWIERERAVGYREGHQNALKQMSQPEQEPVAWMDKEKFEHLKRNSAVLTTVTSWGAFDDDVALYTTPPQPKEPEQEPVPAAMKTVIEAMQQDPDYAWGWHCNIAMSFVDAGGDHYTGNQGAARFMRTLANVEPAHELPPPPPQRTWVGLTIEDKKEYMAQDFGGSRTDAMDWTEKRLMEKNT